jgi:hypothetical protein
MFKAMVTAWHASPPYLGVGSYYHRPDEQAEQRHGDWVVITLEQPLILNSRQVRMLVQKYGTNSDDRMTAMAGAWTLRREILQTGHDGIVAIESAPSEHHMIIVDLGRPPDSSHPDMPGNPNGDGAQGKASNIVDIAPLR